MFRHFSILLSIAILSAGCASSLPTATFNSVSIRDINTRGFIMDVKIDVKNPNSVPIDPSNIDYSLSAAGAKLIDAARFTPGGSIPAKGSSTVTLPIPVTFENLLSVEESIRKADGNLKYGVQAALNFDTAIPVIGVQRVPFTYDGTLNVSELLKKNWSTILSSPTARELAKKVLGGLLNPQ